jgi:membrane protease YdiL (CAAX protease family)
MSRPPAPALDLASTAKGPLGLPVPLWPPRAVVDALLIQPWDRIDARDRGRAETGRLSARAAAVWTVIVSAVCLTLLRFGVMNGALQDEVARQFANVVLLLGAESVSPAGQDLLSHLVWVAGCVVFYLVVPSAVMRWGFGISPTSAYLGPRDYFAHLPLYLLLFAPVGLLVFAVSLSPEFQEQYPFFTAPAGPDPLHAALLQLCWEVSYAVQFFSLEFFFRGFLLRGLAAELGSMAVLLMVIPYCMIHFGKPLPECLGSIIAGLVLGTLAMDTRSIWGGVTVHVAVAWQMDAAALWQKGWFDQLLGP